MASASLLLARAHVASLITAALAERDTRRATLLAATTAADVAAARIQLNIASGQLTSLTSVQRRALNLT